MTGSQGHNLASTVLCVPSSGERDATVLAIITEVMSLTVRHTVEYDHFIRSQLVSRN